MEKVWDSLINPLENIKQDRLMHCEEISSQNKGASMSSEDLYKYYYSIAESLFLRESFEESLVICDKAMEIKPDFDVYYLKSKILYELNDNERALICCQKALDINPNDGHAYCMRGILLLNIKDFADALSSLNKSIELSPTEFSFYYHKASLQTERGDLKDALICLNKALEINPIHLDSYISKAELLKETDDIKASIDCYDKAIELNPKFAFVYNNKGLLHLNLKDPIKALECFEKALEINPDNEGLHINKGSAFLLLRNINAAVTSYAKAIEINPKSSQAMSLKGYALSLLGDLKSALDYYEKAIDNNPNDIQSFCYRFLLYCDEASNFRNYYLAFDDFQKLVSCTTDLEILPQEFYHTSVREKIKEISQISIPFYQFLNEINSKINFYTNDNNRITKLSNIESSLKISMLNTISQLIITEKELLDFNTDGPEKLMTMLKAQKEITLAHLAEMMNYFKLVLDLLSKESLELNELAPIEEEIISKCSIMSEERRIFKNIIKKFKA